MKSVRLERINSELRNIIANIIDNELRDPQIDAIIGVNSVEVTPDLANTRVYISTIGATDENVILNRIKGAGGYIRKRVSQEIKLRITPRFDFYLDNSDKYSRHIEDVLKTIKYSTQDEEENE